MNNFLISGIFCLKYSYHLIRLSFMTYQMY